MNILNSKKIPWLLFMLIVAISSVSTAQGIRKHYEEMTNDERDALIAAYWSLGGTNGTSGLNSQIANFHDLNFGSIHFNGPNDDVFFAWHRKASQELERAMKNNANNEWITTAYWDWTLSNSKSDPLWGNNWLGPFNSAWNLNRDPVAGLNLPTQSDINTALLTSNFYTFSRWAVEQDPLHTAAHNWTGGTMALQNSPKDPVFFFHHNMVDKIWAEWYEIYGVSGGNYYVKTDMPRYPSLDPDLIADPRSLGIFYAEAQLAVLDKYTVSNTHTSSEKFGYQYTIEAEDNFIVPSGKNAEFRSCDLIRLKPGFIASDGSTFLAKIDADCNFGTAAVVSDDSKHTTEDILGKANEDSSISRAIRSYPNPFQQEVTIEFNLDSACEITIEIFNTAGQRVSSLLQNQMQEPGLHSLTFDGQNLPSGLYYCTMTDNKSVKTIRMVLEK